MVDIQATLAERGARYGDFTDHAECSQALLRVIRNTMGPDKWRSLPNFIVEGLQMECHKLARIANGDPLYADSWHDIAGYATLVEQRLQPPVTYFDASNLTPPMEVSPGELIRPEPPADGSRHDYPAHHPDGPQQAPEPTGPGYPSRP